MLHLLTEEHRQKVVREYQKRVLVVFFLGLLSVALVSSVFILPTFFLSYGKYSDFQLKTKTLDDELVKNEAQSSSENVKEVAISIDALRSFDGKKEIYPLVSGLIQGVVSGVQIKNIIFTTNDTEGMIIDLAGKADTRKSLVAFDQKLKSNSLFSEIIIPLGSFAKEKNIDFSMKIIVSTSTSGFEAAANTGSNVVSDASSTISVATTSTQTNE
jgi:predicted CopG family antitoxin